MSAINLVMICIFGFLLWMPFLVQPSPFIQAWDWQLGMHWLVHLVAAEQPGVQCLAQGHKMNYFSCKS